MTFTPEQIKALEAKLDPANVKQRQKAGISLDYLEGWFVIQEANRIFGFDGWSRETLDCEHLHAPYERNGKWVVSYRSRVRITVGVVKRDGTGFGNGIATNETDAHELAIKEAETDATKRAFMTFGNPFGLALYDKSRESVADPGDTATATYLELIRAKNWETREDAVAWSNQDQTHKEWRKNGLLRKHVNAIHEAINEHYPEQEAA